MQNALKRSLAGLLCLCLVLSLLWGLGGTAFAASRNTGTRHEVCTSLSEQAQSYYSGKYDWDSLSRLDGVATDSSLEAMDGELYNALSDLMSDTMTNKVSYSSLTSYWTDTDASANGGQILCYSDAESNSSISREHVWPKSRASFYQKNGGSDLHHLRPENSSVNSTRSNYTMGDVVGVFDSYSTYQYNGNNVLYYLPGADLVEVNDNIKGDVARILLYVYVRWEQPNLCENVDSSKLPAFDSDDSKNNGLAVIEDLDTLLQWCAEDPVDTWEMSRNDCIESIQGNRNVFIDYPEYAWLIFGREVPAGLVTPSGEGKDMEKYEITAVSADPTMGSVSVKGSKVIAVPAYGYVVSRAEVTPADAAKLDREGNVFTLSEIKSNCTVKVYFEKAAAVTVSFASLDEIAPISTVQGGSVTLPSCMTGAEGYTFVGWTPTEIKDETATAPTVYKAGSNYTAFEDTTLYALFSRTEKGSTPGGSAALVTEEQQDWSGTYVIGLPTPKRDVMMSDTAGSTGAYLQYNDAAIADNCITNAAKSNYFTLVKVGSYYAVRSDNGSYLRCDGVKKISLDNSVSSVSESDTAFLWNVSLGRFEHSNAANGVLRYNASSPRFTTYLDSSNQMDVKLYKLGSASVTYYKTFGDVTPPPAPPAPVNPFTDVSGDAVYYDAVMWAYYHEPEQITTGYTETEFRPDAPCTRGQVVTFLWRAAGCPEVKGDCPFTDVAENSPYRTAITWAAQEGIAQGFDADHFRPGDPVSRAQFVTFLWRYEGKPAANAENVFTDVADTSVYFPAIMWAYESGVTVGYGNNDFRPDMTCTRWHVVLFMQRCLDKD